MLLFAKSITKDFHSWRYNIYNVLYSLLPDTKHHISNVIIKIKYMYSNFLICFM